jgi:exosortase
MDMTGSGTLVQEAAEREPASVRSLVKERWQRIVLFVVAAESLLLYAPTVAWLWDRWTLSVWQHAHGLLIPPVVAYYVHQELRACPYPPIRPSPWGFAILVPALALHALDAGMHTQLLSAAAMMLALPGLSLLFLGVERTRAIRFPLAFLAFALPIPLGFTEQFHWQLRQLVTATTASVVPFMGIPVFVEGTTLTMAQGSLEIADACSGFSTLYAAAAVACLTAHSTPNVGRRALVLLAAAPLAIGANILRVVALVMLVVWRGGGILDTFIHPLSGMLTFALALPIVFWLGGSQRPEAHS